MQSITPAEQVHQPVKGNSPLPTGQPDWLRLLLQKRNTRKGMRSERNTYTRTTYRGEYTHRGEYMWKVVETEGGQQKMVHDLTGLEGLLANLVIGLAGTADALVR